MAPLWVSYTANLGTLLRTCDAVGACMAVPSSSHYRRALAQGDTLGLRRRPHVHWATPIVDRWIAGMANSGWQIVAVEITDDAISLPQLEPVRQPSILLLGHEHNGVPEDWIAKADLRVAIPMVGVGASLNVAVAGSLVLYRMAGLA